jgi:hypothetical protein
MKTHPSETDLALLAGGESRSLSRFFLNRHVRECRECTATVARYEMLRAEISQMAPPDLNWQALAEEMRANIHLGLEAGACVRAGRSQPSWNPRLAVALASLMLLIGANFLLKGPRPATAAQEKSATPVVRTTGAGVEFRSGSSSLTLLNHHGAAADRTVSAQGEIRARYIDGGAVTITNVSLE